MRLLAIACVTACASPSGAPAESCQGLMPGVTVDGAAIAVAPVGDASITAPDQIWLELATMDAAEQDAIISVAWLQLGTGTPNSAVDLEYRAYPASTMPQSPATDVHWRGAELSGFVYVEVIAAVAGDHTRGCYALESATSPIVHAEGSFDDVLLAAMPGS